MYCSVRWLCTTANHKRHNSPFQRFFSSGHRSPYPLTVHNSISYAQQQINNRTTHSPPLLLLFPPQSQAALSVDSTPQHTTHQFNSLFAHFLLFFYSVTDRPFRWLMRNSTSNITFPPFFLFPFLSHRSLCTLTMRSSTSQKAIFFFSESQVALSVDSAQQHIESGGCFRFVWDQCVASWIASGPQVVMDIYSYMCVYTLIYCIYMCVYIHIYMYIYICTRIWAHCFTSWRASGPHVVTDAYIYTHIYIYVYIYVYIHIYICVYINMHAYIYAYMFMCICIRESCFVH